MKKQSEAQEKEKDAIETNEVQKTFLEKLKSFFCFCTAKNKDNSRLKKFNYGIKRSKNETQKPVLPNATKKTFLEKLGTFFSSITGKKRKNNHHLKKSSTTGELNNQPQKTFLEKTKSFFCFYKAKKNKVQKPPVKSLRAYIKQNCKWIIFSLVIYIIIFGAVVSTPVIINHLRAIRQNETEQERFEVLKLSKRFNLSSGPTE